jgi:anti-sigma factor RsiW
MTKLESQLRLQAYLDGELPAGEARELESLLRTDREVQDLLAELKATNAALAGHEASIRVPASREFYFSKIRRDIERAEASVPGTRPVSWLSLWRSFLLPTAAVSVAVIATLLMLRSGDIADHQAMLADSGAFTYRDFAHRTTLVWFSYPAQNTVAENEGGGTLPEE